MDSAQMWLPFLHQRLADEESDKSQYQNGHRISRGGREKTDLYNLSWSQASSGCVHAWKRTFLKSQGAW